MSVATQMGITIENIVKAANGKRGCLAHFKTLTGHRRHVEDEDPLLVENLFLSDAAKIAMSKTFRVQAHRTQVFTRPKSPLIRTRLSHVLEVDAVSKIASEMLGLNTDLVHAASLGHDVGHGPFGHQGEAWLQKTMDLPGFCHEVMGPIVTQKIERKGKGLNLTFETLEAMMCHSGNMIHPGASQEAHLLRHTDKFAYLFADYNDITNPKRMGYELPREIVELANLFGNDQRSRTTTAIAGLVLESAACGRVSFEHSELGCAFQRFRKLMYEIYPRVTRQDVGPILEPILKFLITQGHSNPFLVLALMTDRDVEHLTIPMIDLGAFRLTAINEIIPYLENIGPIDLCDPDLGWYQRT